MSATDIIYRRRSTRAFLDKPIPKENLMEVLEAANRTPSWSNSQPWEVFVVSGEKLENLRKVWSAEFMKYTFETMPFNRMDIQFPGYDSWGSASQAVENMVATKDFLVEESGMPKKEYNKMVGGSCSRFFNAPAVIYLGLKKDLGPYSMFDLGAYQQTLLLAAEDKGLQTCTAGGYVFFGDVLRKELGIPEDISMAIGISIGYEDKENIVNKRKPMHRMDLDKYVRFIE